MRYGTFKYTRDPRLTTNFDSRDFDTRRTPGVPALRSFATPSGLISRAKENRLVKATLHDTDVGIESAKQDGLSRWLHRKVVDSGDLDGTTVYYSSKNQIINARDGSQKGIGRK